MHRGNRRGIFFPPVPFLRPMDVAGATHFLGFTTGIALYAMLLWLAVRARPARESLTFATGVLGLLWNAAALLAVILHQLEVTRPLLQINAVAYSALGFLPAVVVHSVLRGDDERPRARVAVIRAAYALSTAGALLQISSPIWPAASQTALRFLTVAFLALILPIVFVTRRQGRIERSFWIAALAIFAISGFHMSHRHIGEEYPWSLELVGHQASLPLAFAILFFDYRFAFADLFLKRALNLILLVAVVAIAFLGVPLLTGETSVLTLIILAVGISLLAPGLRRWSHTFVDRVVLRRTDYATLKARVGAIAATAESPADVLDRVCSELARALAASSVTWSEEGAEPAGDVTIVTVPLAEVPRYAIAVGGLTGGRRLLSDDEAMLDAAALTVARRIDALRLEGERLARRAREQEMLQLKTEAELRALRAQINPHFLFNALNTIGYLIRTAPERAFATLMQLTGLMRSVLGSSGPLVTLGDEMKIVEAYLEIERARFEERLQVSIAIPAALRNIAVPTLLVQPLVENAIKHGISPQRSGGEVSISAELDGNTLQLRVRDTGAGATDLELARGRRDGVGLKNVEQRLRAHYADAASLAIESAPGEGTVVTVILPAGEAATRTLATGVAAVES